jgi:hypothetical protein
VQAPELHNKKEQDQRSGQDRDEEVLQVVQDAHASQGNKIANT